MKHYQCASMNLTSEMLNMIGKCFLDLPLFNQYFGYESLFVCSCILGHARFHIILVFWLAWPMGHQFLKASKIYHSQWVSHCISFFRASQVAKQALDEATAEINSAGVEGYKDSMLMMQLLKENLALWTSELTGGKWTTIKKYFQQSTYVAFLLFDADRIFCVISSVYMVSFW